MIKRILKNIRLILDVSFIVRMIIGFIRIVRRKNLTIPQIPIKEYWKKVKENKPENYNKSEKTVNILAECIGFHPTMCANTLDTCCIIQSEYENSNLIVLLDDYTDVLGKKMAKMYGADKIIYLHPWYYPAFIIGFVQVFIWMFKKLITINSDEVCVGTTEFGNLVYDEYLRWSNNATLNKLTLEFLLFSIRSSSYYWLHQNVKKRLNKIDHVVISHSVYAKVGSMAMIWSDGIHKIWLRFQAKPFAASCRVEKWPISKHFYSDTSIEYFNEQALIDEKIDSDYLDLKKLRTQGKTLDKDSELVFKKEDLNYESEQNNKGNMKIIIVFCHALVDAVKYPRWRVFKDNYTWLQGTLTFLGEKISMSKVNVKVLVRPHPSESLYPTNITGEEVANNFANKYDFIEVMDDNISHSKAIQLADLVLTSHGSVGLEAAAEGILACTAADTPYNKLNITLNANTKIEYHKIISKFIDDDIQRLTNKKIKLARLVYMYRYDKWLIDIPFKISRLGQNNSPSFKQIEKNLEIIKTGYEQALVLNKFDLNILNISNVVRVGVGNFERR